MIHSQKAYLKSVLGRCFGVAGLALSVLTMPVQVRAGTHDRVVGLTWQSNIVTIDMATKAVQPYFPTASTPLPTPISYNNIDYVPDIGIVGWVRYAGDTTALGDFYFYKISLTNTTVKTPRYPIKYYEVSFLTFIENAPKILSTYVDMVGLLHGITGENKDYIINLKLGTVTGGKKMPVSPSLPECGCFFTGATPFGSNLYLTNGYYESRLYKITGKVGSLIGNTRNDIKALAVYNNKLYGFGQDVYTVNTSTGASVQVQDLQLGTIGRDFFTYGLADVARLP